MRGKRKQGGFRGAVGGYGTGAAYRPQHKPEMKFKDTQITDTALAAAGAVINAESILTLAQDNTESGRHGRKISLQRIHLKGLIKVDVASNASTGSVFVDSYVRLCLVVDHQANGDNSGLIPLCYETLDGTNPGFLSYRNLANTSRFTILKEKIVKVTQDIEPNQTSGSTDNYIMFQGVRRWDMNIKCNIPIEYTGITGAIGERACNNVFLVGFTSNAAPTKVKVSAQARIRYFDY
ncbi:putative viral capsid [Circoviridae 1 LDMD-2013]|uniref:putative viral capsid n=1 Tax=Circoviridae 1 LDMD-2013 TaxID=1379692 RepID=UPI0003847219|nr:putative viral capsid [Circoviridae 1 LDMD-2013]AGS36176.1 putative viral capsid [Circoviridae 1 LDMD-2013]